MQFWTDTSGATVSAAMPGQILLIRNNQVVFDYSDTRSTQADYGTGLKAALAASQQFDTIVTGPGEFSVSDADFTTPDLTWIAQGTALIPDATAYTYLLRVTVGADGSIISGLKCWDKNGVGTGTGVSAGIQVTADNVTLDHCIVDGTTGSGEFSGEGYSIFGTDNTLQNCIAKNTNYAGLKGSSNRLTVSGCEFRDCGLAGSPYSRAVEFQGSTAYDWLRFEDCRFLADTINSGALVNINISNTMRHLVFRNCSWHDGDKHGVGVSYDTANREQQCKMQRVEKATFESCDFEHGTNQGAGYLQAVSVDSPVPSDISFTDCTFSDAVLAYYNIRFEKLTYTRCHFGLDDVGELFYLAGIMPGQIKYEDCKFHLGANCNRAFNVRDVAVNSGDSFELINCEFEGNQTGTLKIVDDTSANVLISRPRKIISYGNRLTNSGAGTFVHSTNDTASLMLQTDRNGTKLFDDSIQGAGMPTAGSDPYFSGLPGVENGDRIINTNWTPDGTQVEASSEWLYDGTGWRRSAANVVSEDLIVNDYDPPMDGVTSDHTVINQVMAAAQNGLRGRVVFRPGTYYVNDSISLPEIDGGNRMARFELVGYGAEIQTLTTNVTILSRVISDLNSWNGANEPSTAQGVPRVAGFKLVGQAANSATAGTGLRWDGALGASFDDLTFVNLYRGAHVIFALWSTFENCGAYNCLQGFLATSGAFESAITNATNFNSNCNLITYQNCRAQLADTSAIGFRLQGTGQAKCDRCAAEGTNGDVAFLVEGHDGTGSNNNTQRDTVFEGCWIEISGGGNLSTMYRIETNQSTHHIKGGNIPTRTGTTPNQMVFLDDTGYTQNRNQYIIEGLNFFSWSGSNDPYFKNETNAAGSKSVWRINNCIFDPTDPVLTDTGYWENDPATSILLKGDNAYRGTSFTTV